MQAKYALGQTVNFTFPSNHQQKSVTLYRKREPCC